MRDKGVEMLLLKKQMQYKLNSFLEQSLPELPDDLKKPLKFIPGAVKFGTLAFKDTSDENDNDKNVDYFNEINTKTQGMQTFHNELIDSCTTMSKDVTIVSKERKIQTEKMVQKEIGTDPVPLRDKCTLTNQNKTSSQGSMTDHIENDHHGSVDGKTKPTSEKGQQVFSDVGCSDSGICVSCCQRIQSDANIAASNNSPNVQDIIVLSTTDTNTKEWRKHRRSLIKSRRVQTDLSMSNDSIDKPDLIPSRSLSYEGVINQYRPETKSIALDPIGFPEEKDVQSRKQMRDRATATTFEVKIVAPMKDAATVTMPPRVKDFATMAKPETISSKSQTSVPSTANKGIVTNYVGKSEKGTATAKITLMDSETTMPKVDYASKDTWTDLLVTCDRAMSTEGPTTSDVATVIDPSNISRSRGTNSAFNKGGRYKYTVCKDKAGIYQVPGKRR